MRHDYMGRRFSKKVIVNQTTISHSYYLYHNYLQVNHLDLLHPQPMWKRAICVRSHPVNNHAYIDDDMLKRQRLTAERPSFFMHDTLKNHFHLQRGGREKSRYEYALFGGLPTVEEK